MSKQQQSRASRRDFLRAGALGGGGALAFPFVRDAKAAETTVWKIQTSWPGGLGLKLFKDWCNGIKEKTGGELEFKPFGAKDVTGDFQLYDAVRNGVLDAANPFTIYYQNELPLGSFLSSYPLGPRNPHEWDTFYYGLGGLELAREAYAERGMRFVGIIHHGPNIIHSKVPINSFADFRGRKIRAPGGMVSKLFAAAGASVTTLPGQRDFPRARKRHNRFGRLCRPRHQLRFGLSPSHELCVDGAAGLYVDLPTRRFDGSHGRHRSLGGAVAADEIVRRKRGSRLFRLAPCGDPKSRPRRLAQTGGSRHAGHSLVGIGMSKNSPNWRCRFGSSGRKNPPPPRARSKSNWTI